jgi:threonine synthase
VSFEGWTPGTRLRCISCQAEVPLGPEYFGCRVCTGGEPLEVVYTGASSTWADLNAGISWMSQALQPLAPPAPVRLGQGNTPLIAAPGLGSAVWVKNETQNPTWSHKDRAHAINAGVARLLGAPGMICTTTGNHGASAAAFAAVAGCRAVALCHPNTPQTLLDMIRAYGGVAAKVPAEARSDVVRELVDRGWYPATSMDPSLSGRSTPYGVEAYKLIAYEIVRALGGAPAAIVVPSASGDTLYGIAKGFDELHSMLGLDRVLSIAVQPETANTLQRSIASGQVEEVPRASSIALSIAETRTGRQGLVASRRWPVTAVTVSEAAILESTADLAAMGLLLEPAAASSLAGYRATVQDGLISSEDQVVLLATSAGPKWMSAIIPALKGAVVHSKDQLERLLSEGDRKEPID